MHKTLKFLPVLNFRIEPIFTGYSLLSPCTAPVVIGSPLSKNLAIASRASRVMPVHSTSSSVWQEDKHVTRYCFLQVFKRNKATDAWKVTFSPYFSNRDKVRAKKHTFHPLNFKQVSERYTLLYNRLKKHATDKKSYVDVALIFTNRGRKF